MEKIFAGSVISNGIDDPPPPPPPPQDVIKIEIKVILRKCTSKLYLIWKKKEGMCPLLNFKYKT